MTRMEIVRVYVRIGVQLVHVTKKRTAVTHVQTTLVVMIIFAIAMLLPVIIVLVNVSGKRMRSTCLVMKKNKSCCHDNIFA